jgi:uncharacterized protein YbcV (DUF1398 family)
VNTNVIHEVLAETQAGKLIFPEVLGRLLEVGVESYFCDLATGVETFYLSNGQTQAEKMILPLSPVAAEFSSSEVIAAIREAPADKIRYPEFIKRSAAAGVIAYWAFLTGRKVIYFGRKGESHVEDFPPRNIIELNGPPRSIWFDSTRPRLHSTVAKIDPADIRC